jgi:hypothetical protein
MAAEILAEVEYRDIPGFDGYRAGTDGSVWSCWSRGGKGKQPGNWRKLKGKEHVRSKHIWMKTRYHKTKLIAAHHLVLFAFSGPRLPGMECRHLNGNPQDNRPTNLCWGTRKENIHDAIKHGTFFGAGEFEPRKSDFCSIEGCGEKFFAKDYCQNHYAKFIGNELRRKRRKQVRGAEGEVLPREF